MNKQQILQAAQRVIDERRYHAEEKVMHTLNVLRRDPEWASTEQQLRALQVDIAMHGCSDSLREQESALHARLDELTERAGISPDELTPHYCCDKCNDTGYVDGAHCTCLQQEIRAIIIADSDLPDKTYTFENSTETDRHNKTVYRYARELCHDGKRNLLLVGNVGTGKTYLLTACASLCAQLDKSVLYITAYSLNNAFLNAHLAGSESKDALLDSLTDVDILLIDDLGTEKKYRNISAEYLFVLLNERMTHGRQTFISTNFSLQDLRSAYDERIFSRLADQRSTLVAQLVGKDKRLSH